MKYEYKKEGLVECIPETMKDGYLLGTSIGRIKKGTLKMIDGELSSITFSIRDLFDATIPQPGD